VEARAKQRPIDLAHLARYTGGEASLDADILQLFATQSAEQLRALHAALDARDAESWRRIAHSLKGAARGIGAFVLADVAADAEAVDALAQTEAPRILSALEAEANTVQAFIAAYLAA